MDADKTHYYCGDHSAVASTTNTGLWESKWGQLSVVRHSRTGVPYADPTNSVNFYASTKIAGDVSNLCSGTRTFTVKNISGATYSWTYSSTLSAVGSTNTNQLTIQRNGNSNDEAWVEVQISTPCSGSSVTNRVNFSVGIPTTFTGLFGNFPQTTVVTTDDGSNDINSNTPTYVTFTSSEYIAPNQPSIQYSNMTLLQSSQNFPANSYQWQYIKNSNFGELYLYMPDDSWAYFEFTLSNGCGTKSFYLYFQAYQGAYYRLSPNPAKDIVTIQVDEEKVSKNNSVKSSEQEIREIVIVDKMGNILQRKTLGKGIRATSLNTSSLKPDIYVVRIFNGKTWKSLQMLKQ